MRSISILIILLLVAAGCTSQSAQPAVTKTFPETVPGTSIPEKPVSATVQRIDATKILVTYLGGPDADQLIELETTVINSRGSVKTQSMGSRLDTTPVQIGGTEIFQGPYTEKAHVLITGYFANGTHQDFIDTLI